MLQRPRATALPFTFTEPIRTERLVLRLHTAADLDNVHAYHLHRDFQGKGYAFEAAAATLDLAFRTIGLHRVTAELDPRNLPSIALCKRLGMRPEAHFIEDMMFKGEWADTCVYGILDREWLAR